MAEITIVYWRDIPAQVMCGKGRRAVKRQLADRFAEAIDRAAMKGKAGGTDDYLAEWRKDGPHEAPGEAQEAVEAAATRIEAEYDMARLKVLIANGGHAAGEDETTA